jgi:hypothetical protein
MESVQGNKGRQGKKKCEKTEVSILTTVVGACSKGTGLSRFTVCTKQGNEYTVPDNRTNRK